MAREVNPHEDQPNRKSDSDAKREAVGDQTTYWQDMNALLNFSFSEHWVGLTVVACAICCFFIYLATLNIHPLWWACIGTILSADIIIFALFAVAIRRSQAPPPPAATAPATLPAEL